MNVDAHAHSGAGKCADAEVDGAHLHAGAGDVLDEELDVDVDAEWGGDVDVDADAPAVRTKQEGASRANVAGIVLPCHIERASAECGTYSAGPHLAPVEGPPSRGERTQTTTTATPSNASPSLLSSLPLSRRRCCGGDSGVKPRLFHSDKVAAAAYLERRITKQRRRMENIRGMLPRGDNMSRQTDINAKFRAILVDWLFEVSRKFKAQQQSYHLTISLLDRYLDHTIICRSKLQLVGMAAFLIATKFEEIYPPALQDLVHVSARAYAGHEILRMEKHLLQVVGFVIHTPTSCSFLPRLLDALDASSDVRSHASYICDRALQEYELMVYVPSVVAACAVCISHMHVEPSRRVSAADAWPECMLQASGLTYAQLFPCLGRVLAMLQAQQSGPASGTLNAIWKGHMVPKTRRYDSAPPVEHATHVSCTVRVPGETC